MNKRFQTELSLTKQDTIVQFAVAHNRMATLIIKE